jgi:flagellar biosynthetic protein FliO
MKALKHFIIPVVLLLALTSTVYASAPAYLISASPNASNSGFYSFFRAVYYIVMFGLILAAAYYASKFLSQKALGRGSAKNMKLVESMPLGADKHLHLIRVGEQYFLIGSASKSLFMMSEVEKEKLFAEQQTGELSLEGYEIENYEDNLSSKDFNAGLGSVKYNLKKLKSMVRGSNRDEV